MRYGTLIAVLMYGCLSFGQEKAAQKAAAPPKLDCLSCHQDEKLAVDAGGGKVKSLHVDRKKFGESIHGFLTCADCHKDVKDFPHDPVPKAVECNSCHADQ